MLSLLIVISCNKDLVSIENFGFESLSIEDARSWYESEYDPFIFMDGPDVSENEIINRESPINKMVVAPNWDQAFKSNRKGTKVVEIPLMGKGSIGFTTEDSHEEFKNNGKREYNSSLMRLVIMEEKNSTDKFAFIMVTIGNKEYLENNKFKIWKNTYLKKDNKFDGKALFYALDGSFINGWTWEKGKVVYKVDQKRSNDLEIDLRDCTTTLIFTTYENCTDWIQFGESNGVVFLDPTCNYSTELTGYYIECAPDPDDDNGGGVNQGQAGGGTPYSPSPGDKFAKPGMKQTMLTQISNMCVSSIMEYIDNEYCGGNLNEGTIVYDYFQSSGNQMYFTGVSNQEIPYLAVNYFYFNAFLNFSHAINFGDVVLADVPSDIPNSTHAVVVTGYKTNGDLIYMDPQEGKLMERPAYEVGVTTKLRIKGCK